MPKLIFLLFLFTFLGYSTTTNNRATTWIEKANIAHGTAVLNKSSFRFNFREYTYGLTQKKHTKSYSRTKLTTEGILTDTLFNGGNFKRWINQKPVKVSDSLQTFIQNRLTHSSILLNYPRC